MWIIIAQIICLAVAVVLLAIAFDLDKETSPLVRYPIVIVAIGFFGVFLATFHNRELYQRASGIAFAGFGALILAFVLYLIFTKRVHDKVLKVSAIAFGMSALLWVVGNLSDLRRQELQVRDSGQPSKVVRDSTNH